MSNRATARVRSNVIGPFEELRQRHELQQRQQRLFLEISQRISRTLDLDAILNHLLASLRSVVHYDAAGIFVLNRDVPQANGTSPLEIFGMATRGFDEIPSPGNSVLCANRGIVGHVVRGGEPIVVNDVRRDSRYVVGRSTTLSEIAVPIVSNDRVIGALNLESDRLNAFSDTEIELLEFFANAAAIAIERSMLHAQVLEKQRIEQQLRIAREVQSDLLPSRPPVLPGYDIAAVNVPTSQIGGDYYDYIPLPGSRLGLVIADVAGKGVPAALIMASVRAMLHTLLLEDRELQDVIASVNRALLETTQVSRFVTAVYGVFDPAAATLTYVNCGHNAPLIVRAHGTVEVLDKGGPVLGIFGHAAYESGTTMLGPADTLALFTDGVVEASDANYVEFGPEGLEKVLREQAQLPAEGLANSVLQAARAFAGKDLFEDDFTLIVLKRNPA